MMGLRRRDGEDMPPQLGLFEPARNRSLEDTRPALPEPPPSDHEHATSSSGPRRRDEGKEGAMRLGLSHSVEIEACLYFVQTALQPFRVGAIDPGKAIERRHVRLEHTALLDLRRGNHLAGRPLRINRRAAAQRPYVANRFLP